jgi:hypothetical protein
MNPKDWKEERYHLAAPLLEFKSRRDLSQALHIRSSITQNTMFKVQVTFTEKAQKWPLLKKLLLILNM